MKLSPFKSMENDHPNPKKIWKIWEYCCQC